MISMAAMIWLVLFRWLNHQDSWSLLEQVGQTIPGSIIMTMDGIAAKKKMKQAH